MVPAPASPLLWEPPSQNHPGRSPPEPRTATDAVVTAALRRVEGLREDRDPSASAGQCGTPRRPFVSIAE